MSNMTRARVLVADDHAGNTDLLCRLLQPEFDVVGSVQDGNALVDAAEALAPDVIVTDISMPGLDGIAAAVVILGRNPAVRIVFVTVHGDRILMERGIAAGAMGYVLKITAGDDLVPAVHAALRGERHVTRVAEPGTTPRSTETM
jgi:DNA-binding NarL/FixJ family response regulator